MVRGYIVAALVTLFVLAPAAASAVGLQQIVPTDCNGQGGCRNICDLAILASNVLDDGIYIAIFLSAVLFAWSGGKMVMASSAGDPAGVSAAKKTIWNVAIGLVLILSAWLIVSVIMSLLTNNQNWNNLCSGTTTSLSAPLPATIG